MELEPCHFIIILNFVQLFINLLSIIATKLCSILNPGLPQVKPGFGFEVVNPGLGYPGSGFGVSSSDVGFLVKLHLKANRLKLDTILSS